MLYEERKNIYIFLNVRLSPVGPLYTPGSSAGGNRHSGLNYIYGNQKLCLNLRSMDIIGVRLCGIIFSYTYSNMQMKVTEG